MLKRAAEMQGRSLTDFAVSAAQKAAQRAIEQDEVVRLSLADSERFARALLSPPDPSPAWAARRERRRAGIRREIGVILCFLRRSYVKFTKDTP